MKKFSDTLKNRRMPYCAAVIVAGGSSERFGSDKLFAKIDGKPVLGMTLEAFAASDCIQEIILVVRDSILDRAARLARAYGGKKMKLVVPGGKTRALSSYAGVMSASKKAKLIAIHDGARPLVSKTVIEEAVWAAHRHIAAAPAIAVRDTIKIAQDSLVQSTPNRSTLFAVQTPQVFQADIIRAALVNAVQNNLSITDDCAAAEAIGTPVTLTRGSEENMKITTPLDLDVANLIVSRRKS